MTDSNARERLELKHGRNHQRRVEAIKRWVEYIQSEPPETWGPQQNAVVDDQLKAVQAAETTAAHRQHTKEVADEILAIGDRESQESPKSDLGSSGGDDVDGPQNR